MLFGDGEASGWLTAATNHVLSCSLYYLEKDPIETDCRNVIYLVRPRLELMPLIAAQVS
jgi:hypothetical protein